jgi:cyclin B
MKNQKEINEKMRSILVDWIIDVHYKFGFTDETLYMTVSIIDRYLTINQIKRSNFQLLGITALMIACKHEEIDLPKIDDFIYITDNAYVKNEVIKMEEDVLSQLNFEFLYPSPIKFFEYLSLHFNFNKKHHLMGKYLMETFLLDIKNIKYNSSIISCACAYIVMKFFKFPNYYESYDKKFYTLDENKDKYSESNIKECAKDICLFVDNINKTNYQACIKKYSKPEQEKVAVIIMNN